jgi:aryl-alcohol dehydrogenase-like predicted oxidoreductase
VRRDEVIVTAEGGLRIDGTALARDAGARWLRTASRQRLLNSATDYVDLYQVHWPDPATPAEETAAAKDARGSPNYAGPSPAWPVSSPQL